MAKANKRIVKAGSKRACKSIPSGHSGSRIKEKKERKRERERESESKEKWRGEERDICTS